MIASLPHRSALLIRCGAIASALVVFAFGATDDDLPLKLTPLAVTASRGQGEDPQRVPQSIDVLSPVGRGSETATDVGDLLRRLPNIGLAPAEGTSNFWQEGFTLRGLGGQRVLVLTDGVRQSGQGIGYGGGNLSLYDLFGLDRIEVLRGPASVLYGTDALGGVINIITREPVFSATPQAGGGLRYEYDAARNLERFSVLARVGSEKAAVVATASAADADRPDLADGTKGASGAFHKKAASLKADFKVGANARLRLLGNINRDTDVLVSQDTITILRPSALDFSFPLYQRSQLGAELRFERPSASLDEVRLGLHWQQIARQFDRTAPLLVAQKIGPVAVGPRQESVRVVTDDTTDTYELQGLARGRFDAHAWLLGFDLGLDQAYLPETETRTLVYNPLGAAPVTPAFSAGPVARLRADAEQRRLGIYAQDRWTFSPAWEATFGMRVDGFQVDEATGKTDGLEETGVSGNLALARFVNDRLSLYGQLATGFRAPDLGERFQTAVVSVVSTTTVIGQPNLEPERSLNAEFGAKYRSGRIQATAAVFANRVRNYIETVALDATTSQYTNLDSVLLYGAEAGLEVRVAGDWTVFANAGRTYAPADDDRVHLASWVFNYGAGYRLRLAGGNVSLRPEINLRTALRAIERTGSAPVDFAGYTTVDAQVSLQGLLPARFGTARVVLGVRNLFDRAYREAFFNSVQIGRGLYTSATWEF
jgi:hemoglobin/transferrin/lactoferrin receptor protein